MQYFTLIWFQKDSGKVKGHEMWPQSERQQCLMDLETGQSTGCGWRMWSSQSSRKKGGENLKTIKINHYLLLGPNIPEQATKQKKKMTIFSFFTILSVDINLIILLHKWSTLNTKLRSYLDSLKYLSHFPLEYPYLYFIVY